MPSRTGQSNTKPAAGERKARRGYLHQDRFSARLIYEAILDRSLLGVGLADHGAGIFDDLVLIQDGLVVGHQFKVTDKPRPTSLSGLLLGNECTIQKIAKSYLLIRSQFPTVAVKLRYFTNHGSAWTSDGFRTSWSKGCAKAGVAGVTFHDLRGTAVTRLAVAGCTVPEIATITGHSLKDVAAILDSHYLSRDSDLATSAIRKLERRTKRPTKRPTARCGLE